MARPVIAWKPATSNPELASARLRCFKPAAHLRDAGWDCRLFDDTHMDRYRIVVFQKAYTSHDLEIAAHLRSLGVRTVFDLCDNHFYNPSNRPEYRARADRLRRMIDLIDTVSVATTTLSQFIDRPSIVIDDALDDPPPPGWAGRLSTRLRCLRRRPLRLIWYGNAGSDDPPFGLIDLARLRPELEKLHRCTAIALSVVSNSRMLFDRYLGGTAFPATYSEWDTARFPALFRQHDICLIPVTANPFTICKTVNRLALSLLLGVPAIVDRIPSYDELRSFTLFGDWDVNLAIYANDPVMRRRHVQAGQAYLKAKYNHAHVVSQWSALLLPLAA